jgi:hypothetical protein
MESRGLEMHDLTTEEIKEVIEEYNYFLVGRSGSFTTSLYQTIHKADPINQYRLAKGYPAHVLVYNLYCNGPESSIFFEYKVDGEPLGFGHNREEKIMELGVMVYGSIEKCKQAWCMD